MKKFHKYLIGLIIFILLFSNFFFVFTKKAEATVPVSDADARQYLKSLVKKEVSTGNLGGLFGRIGGFLYGEPGQRVGTVIGQRIKFPSWDATAYAIANMLIKRMAQDVVTWINSGFQGNPFFVTNPGDFLKDAADQASGIFFNELGLIGLCQPFRLRVELALKFQRPFQMRMQCTLSRVVENIEAFENNFLAGGWAGWLAMTQQPQNNIYGAYLESADELARRQEEAKNSATMEANWGQGFLSIKECVDEDKNGQCLKSISTTPGKAIEDRLNVALGTDFRRIEAADEMNEIFAALFNQLFISLLSIGQNGKNKITDINTGEPTTEDIENNLAAVVNDALNIETSYRQIKQNSLNTIGDIITALNTLKDCYTAASSTDPRIQEIEGDITDYNGRAESIQGDIGDSDDLIVAANSLITDINNATTPEQFSGLFNSFYYNLQPVMHTNDDVGDAQSEYDYFRGELRRINREYDDCVRETIPQSAP